MINKTIRILSQSVRLLAACFIVVKLVKAIIKLLEDDDDFPDLPWF